MRGKCYKRAGFFCKIAKSAFGIFTKTGKTAKTTTDGASVDIIPQFCTGRGLQRAEFSTISQGYAQISVRILWKPGPRCAAARKKFYIFHRDAFSDCANAKKYVIINKIICAPAWARFRRQYDDRTGLPAARGGKRASRRRALGI